MTDWGLSPTQVMVLPHHGFTVLLTENPKVLIEISVSTLVFTKVRTVFAVCGVLKMVDRLNTKNDYG